MENFKSMYPREIQVIQSYVSEACDRMDYQNSPMYDEWPEQRLVDQMCNLVCEAVNASGDIGILRDAWEMQEKKIIERMSVEEKQEEEILNQEKEGVEKGTDREKEKVETEELNDEENKKKDGNVDERREEDIKEDAEDETIEGRELTAEERKIHKEENAEEVKIQENKNHMESDMEENIYQVTAEADLREHNRRTESRKMSPSVRRWWNGNGWGINESGPDMQGMDWEMESMYAPVAPVKSENSSGLQEQELSRPYYITGSMRPPYPPQGPGPVRPPYPPQGSGPMRPPYPPQGQNTVWPPRPLHPPRPGIYPAWFRDIVKTLILDEMQNRRCRRGMCIG